MRESEDIAETVTANVSHVVVEYFDSDADTGRPADDEIGTRA